MHLQLKLRKLELPPVRLVPESDESVVRIVQQSAEVTRYAVGVRQLEDEASAADAELQRFRRRVVGARSPMNAEADDKAATVDVFAAEVERGV